MEHSLSPKLTRLESLVGTWADPSILLALCGGYRPHKAPTNLRLV